MAILTLTRISVGRISKVGHDLRFQGFRTLEVVISGFIPMGVGYRPGPSLVGAGSCHNDTCYACLWVGESFQVDIF